MENDSDNIPIGKRICLRPIASTNKSTENVNVKTENKLELFTSGANAQGREINCKRLRAQKLYQASNVVKMQNPIPVRNRIGGQLIKRRQGMNNSVWYQCMNNQFMVNKNNKHVAKDPRSVAARRKLNALRLKLHYRRTGVPGIVIKARCGKSKYPNMFVHSIQAALDPAIQAQMKIYRESVIEPQTIPDEPLPLEAHTTRTLNERFSSYP